MSAPPGGERARLFVALDLPPDVRAELSSWSEGVVAGRDALRRVRPEMLHVTLCFLGSHPTAAVDAIAAVCEPANFGASGAPGVTGAPAAPELSIARAMWLPARRPKVLAAGLSEREDRLSALQHALATRLEAGGWYPPEKRPFLAHLTVARVRSRTRLRPFELTPPPALTFVAPSVTLYRSRTESSGARYEALASFALGGAGEGG